MRRVAGFPGVQGEWICPAATDEGLGDPDEVGRRKTAGRVTAVERPGAVRVCPGRSSKLKGRYAQATAQEPGGHGAKSSPVGLGGVA